VEHPFEAHQIHNGSLPTCINSQWIPAHMYKFTMDPCPHV
jgi:hypothetical protein